VARAERAVASWLCVAGFRRVCLFALPLEEGGALRCIDCYLNEMAANSSMTSRVAGGPADL